MAGCQAQALDWESPFKTLPKPARQHGTLHDVSTPDCYRVDLLNLLTKFAYQVCSQNRLATHTQQNFRLKAAFAVSVDAGSNDAIS